MSGSLPGGASSEQDPRQRVHLAGKHLMLLLQLGMICQGLGTGKVLATGALEKPQTSSELCEAAFLSGSSLEGKCSVLTENK